MSEPAPVLLLVIVTLILPPLGVFMISGCGPDFLVNLILSILGYFPGHVHAFYLVYVYYSRRSQARTGTLTGSRAPFVFSDRIQSGGTSGYGTVAVSSVPEETTLGGEPPRQGAEHMTKPGGELVTNGAEPMSTRGESKVSGAVPITEKSVHV